MTRKVYLLTLGLVHSTSSVSRPLPPSLITPLCLPSFGHLCFNTGLKIRVVLWPQSTKTTGGPPDSARWWSGGLLKNSP